MNINQLNQACNLFRSIKYDSTFCSKVLSVDNYSVREKEEEKEKERDITPNLFNNLSNS